MGVTGVETISPPLFFHLNATSSNPYTRTLILLTSLAATSSRHTTMCRRKPPSPEIITIPLPPLPPIAGFSNHHPTGAAVSLDRKSTIAIAVWMNSAAHHRRHLAAVAGRKSGRRRCCRLSRPPPPFSLVDPVSERERERERTCMCVVRECVGAVCMSCLCAVCVSCVCVWVPTTTPLHSRHHDCSSASPPPLPLFVAGKCRHPPLLLLPCYCRRRRKKRKMKDSFKGWERHLGLFRVAGINLG